LSPAPYVPETQIADEHADEGPWTTLIDHGRIRLLTDAVSRVRSADGTSHARSQAFLVALVAVQGLITFSAVTSAVAGTATGLGDVASRLIAALSPGPVSGDLLAAMSIAEEMGADDQLVVIAVSALGALVTGVVAMGQLERGFNRLYGVDTDRPTLSKYAVALRLTLSAGVLFALAFGVLALGGVLGRSVEDSRFTPVWAVVRLPVGLLLVTAAVALLVRHCPRRTGAGLSWAAVGAAVSVVIWTATTLLLNVAYAATASIGAINGPLAGMIVLLLWSYVSSLGLLYGVAVTAELEAVRARSVGLDAPRPTFDGSTSAGAEFVRPADPVDAPPLPVDERDVATIGPFAAHIPRPSHLLLRSSPLVIATAIAGVALGLVAALREHWLLPFDEAVANAVRGDSLVGFFRFWTQLGSQQDMILAAVAIGVLLWTTCRPFALAFPAAVLAGVIIDVSVKVIVDRPRPPDPLVGTALGSFPSGHALTGVIFFGLLPPALWIALRRRLIFWISVPVAAVVAFLVAASRVYLGGHWPTDVIASALLGASVLLGTEWVLGTAFARRHCDGCPLHRGRSDDGNDEAEPDPLPGASSPNTDHS
jgi:YihY family inner membrane protein